MVHGAARAAEPVVREVAAVTIEDHYEERNVVALLSSPDTDANLRAMATGQNRYWNNDAPAGLTNAVGSLMSASTRFGALVATRDGNFIAGAAALGAMLDRSASEGE